MSPSPAAPSSASISACASTSPSEWPASPRGWSSSTPPSTSGTPSARARARRRRCRRGGSASQPMRARLDALEIGRASSPSAAARRRRRPSTRPPAASTSDAQSEPSPSPASAARSTAAANACGVCTATSSSRGERLDDHAVADALDRVGDGETRDGAVEALARAPRAAAARARAAAAAAPRRGRGRRPRPRAPRRARRAPRRTASRRRGRRRRPSRRRAPRRAGSPAPPTPGGATTTIASIHSHSSSRRSGSASSGSSPRRANAFGPVLPSRSPRPAATRTAQTPAAPAAVGGGRGLLLAPAAFGWRRAPLLLRRPRPASSPRASARPAREHVLEPRERVVLGHVLRVHQLGGEDLLRLDVHLLLAGREALLAVAERRGSGRPRRARRCRRSSSCRGCA